MENSNNHNSNNNNNNNKKWFNRKKLFKNTLIYIRNEKLVPKAISHLKKLYREREEKKEEE